ncbi:MAG: peptide deformylase [Myxococcales bacterium]|nr:peptide deformylase [Myxococcales bacterium]
MAVREVVKYPDPRLREDTFDVEAIDDNIRELVRDLIDTMYSLNAAGIAAIQIGRLERIFIIDGKVAGGDENAEPVVFINPEVVDTGKGEEVAEEGCLSFPDVYVDIRRPRWAKVRAKNLDGAVFEADSDGLYGRALQHEHDHLTGRLMIDLVGMVKKEMIKRKMKRWHATDGKQEKPSTPTVPELV